MKKIAIIGQFPPPLHGLSKALDTLYNSFLNKKFDFIKIDITNNSKFLLNIIKIYFSNVDIYYLTISQSRLGNIRDLIIISLVQWKKKKIIIHLHGGGFRDILENNFSYYQRKLNYKILSNVDAGIVLGDSLRYIFEGIIPSDKIYVIKNCVDNQYIINDTEFEEKMLSLKNKKKFQILYLSNFILEKGYKEVLQLAKLLKEKDEKNFQFVFAGKFFTEADKYEFNRFIKKNRLEDLIEYKGIISGKKKVQALKDSDYFILLTRYKNEGQPISIIESAANGVRIVTTNHAGILDILDEREMIVSEKENIDLQYILNRINFDIEKREELIISNKKNRKHILKEFSERVYLEEIEKIFNMI